MMKKVLICCMLMGGAGAWALPVPPVVSQEAVVAAPNDPPVQPAPQTPRKP